MEEPDQQNYHSKTGSESKTAKIKISKVSSQIEKKAVSQIWSY